VNPALVAFGNDDHCVRIVHFSMSESSSSSSVAASGARMSVIGETARQTVRSEEIPFAKLQYKYIHADKVRGIAWNGSSTNELVSAGWDRIVVRHSLENM
jgi:hypothetical protein